MNKLRQKFYITIGMALFVLSGLASAASGETALDLFPNLTDDYQNVKIKRVISTDTIMLESGEKIKLIGLRAPEVIKKKEVPERDKYGFIIEPEVDPTTPVEEQALEFVQRLLEGETVRLEFDRQKKSNDYKTLAYIYLQNGTLANTEILRFGYAYLQIQPPNLKYADLLRAAYKEARQERRGLQGS